MIAAGNSFCGIGRVGSPGAATAALTVGAVDKSDQMASFSSCGPRVGDHAVKPEITAPGVGIVAARAAGTDLGTPVDDHYTSMNGTSMATPHVAGAAALLAQANPELSWSELKDTLVSTANDGGFRWYEQGTGRVDVRAAVSSPVHATGTVNFGGVDGQVQQEITYTSHSDSDIALQLEVAVTDRGGQPIGGVALSAATATIPANGQASVTVTVDAAEVSGIGPFGGVVTATGPNVNVRTGIGFGPPLHRVTIEVLDSAGNRIGTDNARDWIVNLVHDTYDDRHPIGAHKYNLFTNDGIATALVPTGTYTVMSNVLETDPDTGEFTRNGVLTEVEIDIDADITLTLDSRDTVPIDVTVPRKVDRSYPYEVSLIRKMSIADDPSSSFTLRVGSLGWPTYATPAPPGDLAYVALFVRWTLADPQPMERRFGSSSCPRDLRRCFYTRAPAYIYNLAFLYENGVPDNLREKVTREELVAVPTSYKSDNPDALIRRQFIAFSSPTVKAAVTLHESQVWFRPGKVVEYFLADERIGWGRRVGPVHYPPWVESTQWSPDRFPTAEAGTRRHEEHWFQAPIRVGTPDFRQEYLDEPNNFIAWATASRGGPDGSQFIPGAYAMDNSRGHASDMVPFGSWRMWNQDTGIELEGVPGSMIGARWLPAFSLEENEATYRLKHTMTYPANQAPLFLTGSVTTTWTFASQPSADAVPDGYRCPIRDDFRNPQEPWSFVCQIQPLIRLEYGLGLDINNRAPAGRTHRFTINAGHHSKAIDRAKVTDLSVEASFDDGQTWVDARVVGKPKDTWDTGGFLPAAEPYQEFQVVLSIPPLHRTNGFVGLRVRAEDANGGTVEQEIDRAYLLKEVEQGSGSTGSNLRN